MDRPPLERRTPDERFPPWRDRMAPDVLGELGCRSMGYREAIDVSVLPEDEPLVCAAEARRILDERLQHRLKVERRPADDLEYFARRRLLLERLAELGIPRLQLLEQPDVLDGDNSLAREGTQEGNLLVAERPDLAAVDHDRAHDGAFLHHRHAQPGPDTPDLYRLDPDRIPLLVCDVGDQVGYLDWPLLSNQAPQSGVGSRPPRAAHDEIREHRIGAAMLDRLKCLPVVEEEEAELRLAEPQGILEDCAEHGRQVIGGAADHAQHFAGGRLLLQRFGQLPRAVLDLLLEIGVGLLKPAAHAVELLGQGLELIARVDFDAVAEPARADARRPGLERPDGLHHLAGQQQAGEDGEAEAEHEQQDRALNGSPKGGEGLLERLLDEHRPAKRADGGIGREHTVALEVPRDRHIIAALARQRQAGHGSLDLRDHVPDELEVYLGHGDASLLAAAGQGQGHVGLRLLAEIHRPIVDAGRARLDEAGLPREIRLAAEHVHRQPGHPQLLPTLGVQIAELRNGRNLALQAKEIDAPLLESGNTGRQDGLGRPAHLALDLSDELLDAAGGGLRLLPLDGHQRGLVLLVREVQLDEAAGQQRRADQAGEKDHVLDEEPAATLHARGKPRP